MCGINGQINFNDKPIDPTLFLKMRDTLTHRGPDGCGQYFSKDRKVALGHRRLTLIDLTEAGSQPMTNEDGSLWLTYNGEIYNFHKLRALLEKAGHRFVSSSDSEVIIHGYEEWGDQVLQRLKGMFAFALWDTKNRRLLLARDRFGIKPLYYHHNGEQFIFGSEIKAIVENPAVPRRLDYSSFCDFFVYRYVPSPKTIWQDVSKLPPAHCLTLEANGKATVKCYWEPHFGDKEPPERVAIQTTDRLLEASVKGHVISDVAVGSFLSGGYDSSALVHYMSRINYPRQTFAIGFENWPDSEHRYAELVAGQFGARHRSLVIGEQSLDIVEKLAGFYDEPIADISIVPTYLVSQMAAENVKAVLSGEGADELFCGYTWQRQYFDYYNNEVPRWQRWKNKLGLSKDSFAVEYYSNAMAMGKFDNAQLRELLNDDLHKHIPEDSHWFYRQHYRNKLSPMKSIQLMDIKCFMAELVLVKIDRASMANSLEVRVPFLDHELYEYVLGLNESIYFKPDAKKFLLYENIRRHLPETIMQRKKQGFVGPDSYYMHIDWYASALRKGALINSGLIKRERLETFIQQKDHWRLWKLLVMEQWFKRWGT